MIGFGVTLLIFASLAAGAYAFVHAHNFPDQAEEAAVDLGMKLMAGFGIAAVVLLLASEARAHDAIPTAAKPSGWQYPFICCSGYDCREVGRGAVKEGKSGYSVPSGEVIAYNDRRIKDSPDGEFHWCTVQGKDDGKTLCLFVPPRGF